MEEDLRSGDYKLERNLVRSHSDLADCCTGAGERVAETIQAVSAALDELEQCSDPVVGVSSAQASDRARGLDFVSALSVPPAERAAIVVEGLECGTRLVLTMVRSVPRKQRRALAQRAEVLLTALEELSDPELTATATESWVCMDWDQERTVGIAQAIRAVRSLESSLEQAEDGVIMEAVNGLVVAMEELVASCLRRVDLVLAVLRAGGEESETTLASVLESCLDLLDSAATLTPRTPRKGRKVITALSKRAEEVAEGVDAELVSQLSECGTCELELLCGAICAIEQLRGGEEVGDECVVAVTQLLEQLERCRDPMTAHPTSISEVLLRDGSSVDLSELTLSSLKQVARREFGMGPAAVTGVDEAADPKASIIGLILASATGSAATADNTGALEVRAKLTDLSLNELKVHAIALGLGSETLEQLDSADDPRGAAIDMLVAMHRAPKIGQVETVEKLSRVSTPEFSDARRELRRKLASGDTQEGGNSPAIHSEAEGMIARESPVLARVLADVLCASSPMSPMPPPDLEVEESFWTPQREK